MLVGWLVVVVGGGGSGDDDDDDDDDCMPSLCLGNFHPVVVRGGALRYPSGHVR